MSGARTTGAVTGPLVAGVQASGAATRLSVRGAIIRTLAPCDDQPRPNSKPSLWTFARPHAVNLDAVHASALRMPANW